MPSDLKGTLFWKNLKFAICVYGEYAKRRKSNEIKQLSFDNQTTWVNFLILPTLDRLIKPKTISHYCPFKNTFPHMQGYFYRFVRPLLLKKIKAIPVAKPFLIKLKSHKLPRN